MEGPELYLDYLNAPDVAALALTDNEIIEAVEAGLAAQGRGDTVIEPRMHLVPGRGIDGHFNAFGHMIAAEEILRELEKAGLLGETVTSPSSQSRAG